MKVIFVINTFLFRMRVKANWNLPHLPRIGERISPHVIMFQEEFTYHNVLKYLTDEAKNDFNKFRHRGFLYQRSIYCLSRRHMKTESPTDSLHCPCRLQALSPHSHNCPMHLLPCK